MYSLAHLLPLGQRKHIIELYFRPLTLKRFIVIGCKQDRQIPMGTRVTPKPLASVGKVVGFNYLVIICVASNISSTDEDVIEMVFVTMRNENAILTFE